MTRSHYYNPFRAWYQMRLYRPVAWLADRMWVPERTYSWMYRACGAGRRSTRKEAKRVSDFAASLPLTPRKAFNPLPSPPTYTTEEPT